MTVAIVYLPNSLLTYTGGQNELAIDAPRVVELKAALALRFPGVDIELDRMAVAIDGLIHHDADYQPLGATTEVHFVPPVSGGGQIVNHRKIHGRAPVDPSCGVKISRHTSGCSKQSRFKI